MKTGKRPVCPRVLPLVLLAVAVASAAEPLTVGQAVERALKNYPSVRVSEEQINAASAGIRPYRWPVCRST